VPDFRTNAGSVGDGVVAVASDGNNPNRGDLAPSVRPTLPDFLRPLTVVRFAPYRPVAVSLVAGVATPILNPNPMRVGVLFGVTGAGLLKVSLTVADAPTGYVVFRIGNDEQRSGMLADLFSLVNAGWVATAEGNCTLSVCEFVRPL
jgi:hypothetical protein